MYDNKQSRELVADIVEAVLCNLNLYTFRKIAAATEDSWHASMNLSTSSQLEAQAKKRDAIRDAVLSLSNDAFQRVLSSLPE